MGQNEPVWGRGVIFCTLDQAFSHLLWFPEPIIVVWNHSGLEHMEDFTRK